MGSTTQADPLLFRTPQSQFDPTKFFIIGGAGRGGSVLIIDKAAEPRLRDKSKPPVVMGALAGVPRSGMQMTAWGMGFLGWNAKWVVGYPGTNDLTIALERGEIDMTTCFSSKTWSAAANSKSWCSRDSCRTARPPGGRISATRL
jgi:hypothetical protein